MSEAIGGQTLAEAVAEVRPHIDVADLKRLAVNVRHARILSALERRAATHAILALQHILEARA